MGLIIPDLKGGYNKFGGGYMSDGKGNTTKIGGMYYADGKGNAIKIYSSLLPVGTSLYDGIPSNGMILYTNNNNNWGSNLNNNPSIMVGNSINLKNVISQCPNGIQINFGSNLYYVNNSNPYTTSNADSKVSFPSIKISKGSSSGSVEFLIDSSLQLSDNYVKINANLSNNILTLNNEGSNNNGNSYDPKNNDTELAYDYKTYNNPYFTIASITAY